MDNLESEVRIFLERRGPDYQRFLETVLSDLYRYKDAGPHASSIYRIYSRADKQRGGRVLKSEAGIANTLRRWRKDNPSAQIFDVHDIIGITIVTYFESEVAKLVEELKSGRFLSFSFDHDWEKKEDGYYAHHLAVARRHGTGLNKYLCEIQVKSLLNDGWAAKTHDLTYKSRSGLDPEVKRQVELIGVVIQTLEQQSDSLRNLIMRGQQLDAERREAAVFHLLQTMVTTDGPSFDVEAAKWSEGLLKRLDHFASCDDSDQELAEMITGWKAILSRLGPSQIACRLITLLAVIRSANDFDADAYETIDKWIELTRNEKPEGRALAFKTIAQWALGDYDGAITTLQYHIATSTLTESGAQAARINLAYYMAERHFTHDGACSSEECDTIMNLIEGWEAMPDERVRMSRQDSVGAIRIMIATTAEQVFEGWRLCSEAHKWAQTHKDAPVFNVFYKLHSERARRRIQELGAS